MKYQDLKAGIRSHLEDALTLLLEKMDAEGGAED